MNSQQKIALAVAAAFKERRGQKLQIVAQSPMPYLADDIQMRILDSDRKARIVQFNRNILRECASCSEKQTCKDCNTVGIERPPSIAFLEEAKTVSGTLKKGAKRKISLV
jgi:hypothetical protein